RTPGASEAGRLFQVVYYIKPDNLTTADASATPFFPANILYLGTYAKGLLEENGGEITREFIAAQRQYELQRTEALNRFNADTGTDMFFIPTGM
ncbi:MAG: hypothetical protein V3R41_05155, partial [Gammaproteobacteria bacterium]